MPTYTLLKGFSSNTISSTIRRTDWCLFKVNLEKACDSFSTEGDFYHGIGELVKQHTKTYKLPRSFVMIDAEYERLRALRRRYERKARKTYDPEDIRKVRRQQKRIKRHLDRQAQRHWRDHCATLDPRKPLSRIYSLARDLRTTPQQRQPFRALALRLDLSELAVAEEYSKKLTENVGNSTIPLVKFNNPFRACPYMDAPFDIRELDEALSGLRFSTSPGPDGMTYAALFHLATIGKVRLLKLYNTSWETGQVPRDWKTSSIIPILKQGKSPLDLSSFRPVALSSCVGKIMERMIHTRLEWYLEQYDIYPEVMAGFRRGRNSLDNIIDLTTSIEKQKKSRRITTAVFLDIKGAFDSVSHKAICNALCYAGIGGHLYAWILDYLLDASERVKSTTSFIRFLKKTKLDRTL